MRVIDLFAGAGGFSTGAAMAGAQVVWAANHWRAAVVIHKHNHPDAIHVCQDLHQADWSQVPEHDVMLASPSCQGHSRARGKDRPHHDAARSTAWAVVSAAEFHRPSFVVVENVHEFLEWELYPAWRLAMESLGYTLSENLIDAADHAVPQHRKRLFLICSQSRAPFQLRLKPKPHVPVAPYIDWDYPKWTPIRKPGRSRATLERVRNGQKRYGDRFVMPYYGSGSGRTGRSIERPIGTITTRDRWAVVDGDRMRMLQPHEYRDLMGFPKNYLLPGTRKEAIHMLGNAVCPPVARDIVQELRRAA